jgi:Xaa-Pro dipeptidase
VSQDERTAGRPSTPASLAFSLGEYERRSAAAEAAVAGARMDAFLSTILGNICWVSGFQTLASYSFALYALLIQPGRPPALVSSDFESHNARVDSWIGDVRTYGVMADPTESLADLLTGRGLASAEVGIETGYGALTIDQFVRLQARLADVRLVPADGTLERLRAVKSAEELGAMREAARISSLGMRAALDAVRPGAADNDVAAAAVEAVVRAGGEHFAIVPIVTSGRRSGIPHTTFRRVRLQPGDPLFIEVCGTYQRYSAPLLRTASLGEPSPEIRRAFEACRASVETLIAEIRPGIVAGLVAQRAGAAMRAIEPSLLWHGYYGGSTGLSFSPTYSDGGAVAITETSDDVLVAGMTFHASTSLRKLGEFGVTVGETVAVTESGCEVLTDVPRELRVAALP